MRGTTIASVVHGSEEVLVKYRAEIRGIVCTGHKYKCAQGRAKPPIIYKALTDLTRTHAETGPENASSPAGAYVLLTAFHQARVIFTIY